MIEQFTTKNGLRVVLEPMPYLASVAAGVFIGTGSEDEVESENGLSHCLEHMVFKGTERRDSRQIATDMDAIGGQINASTSKELTCFYGKVLDERLPELVDLLADLVQGAALDAGELQKEKGVILEEIAMVEDTPEDIVHELAIQAQLDGHPLARTILGSSEVITSLTDQHLKAYYHAHYLPKNAVLSLAGNVTRAQAEELAERYFGAWKVGELPQRYGEISLSPPKVLRREKDAEQLHICLSFPGIQYGNDDIYPLTIFNILFGTSMSSRLFQKIREERGLVYSVYSYISNYVRAGLLTIYAGTNPQNGEQVVELVREEIANVLREGIPDAEIEQARGQLRSNFRLGLESNAGRMQGNGHSLCMLDRIKNPEQTLEQIQAVKKEDVERVARAVFSGTYSAALVGPGKQGRRGGSGVDCDVEAILGPCSGGRFV